MATLTKVSPSLATLVPDPSHTITKKCGEAIAVGDLCYVKSDGLIWRSNGTSANAAAKVRGMAAVAADVGKTVSIYHGVQFRYGSGLTPGAEYFLSATAGAIDDAATTGGTGSIAWAVDDTTIYVKQSGY